MSGKENMEKRPLHKRLGAVEKVAKSIKIDLASPYYMNREELIKAVIKAALKDNQLDGEDVDLVFNSNHNATCKSFEDKVDNFVALFTGDNIGSTRYQHVAAYEIEPNGNGGFERVRYSISF